MIDNTLYDAFGQRQVSIIYTLFNQYHVVMEVDPRFWQNPETLRGHLRAVDQRAPWCRSAPSPGSNGPPLPWPSTTRASSRP